MSPSVRTRDAFDLLGVSSREDSYSDLIVNGFNECDEFRERTLGFLGEPFSTDWRARPRMRIRNVVDGGADVPDIVLWSAALGRIVVIENKIWSEEGVDQLRRYAKPAFVDSLSTSLLETPNHSSYRLVYLTVEDQHGAKAELAKCMMYDDFCLGTLDPPLEDGSTVSELLNQMAARFRERSEWTPDGEGPMSELFVGGPVMLSARERLLATAQLLGVPEEFDFRGAVVNNQQHGETPLVQIRKADWVIDPDDPSEFSRSCDSHFEIQWLRRNDELRTPEGLSVEVHFETSPYMPQRQAKASPEQFEGFDSARRRFRDSFLACAPEHWRRPRRWGWVTAASLEHPYIPTTGPIWLPPELPVSEMLGLVSAAIRTASPTISNLIEELGA